MAKEILIDGVDVNKCEQHSDLEYISNNNGYEEVPNNCGVYADRICENHSNCYYKQLKRKEQELQQLKETLKDHDSEGEAIGLAYDALKSEFDKLKAENSELKEKYKYYDHYKESALYNKDLCNKKSDELDKLKAENEELKKELKLLQKR